MSEAKSKDVMTPGPWEYGCHPANEKLHIVKPIMFGSRMGKLPECEGEHSFIRNEADARLIAAAPELLDVVRRVASAAERFSRDDAPLGVAARAALAKAEGRAS